MYVGVLCQALICEGRGERVRVVVSPSPRIATSVCVGGGDRDPAAVVHAALDADITMVDTADTYQNEEPVGTAIRGP